MAFRISTTLDPMCVVDLEEYLRSLRNNLLILVGRVDTIYIYTALFFSSQENFTKRAKNNCAVVSDVRNDAIPMRSERCS